MNYRIRYSHEARGSLRTLPGNFRQRVRRTIEALADNPRPVHAKLLRATKNEYRIRLDGWRIIYRVEDDTGIVGIGGIRWKTGPETYEDVDWEY